MCTREVRAVDVPALEGAAGSPSPTSLPPLPPLSPPPQSQGTTIAAAAAKEDRRGALAAAAAPAMAEAMAEEERGVAFAAEPLDAADSPSRTPPLTDIENLADVVYEPGRQGVAGRRAGGTLSCAGCGWANADCERRRGVLSVLEKTMGGAPDTCQVGFLSRASHDDAAGSHDGSPY